MTHHLTIRASQFRDLVSPVLPLADKDAYGLPILNGVHIRTHADGVVSALATDRYRAGLQRVHIPTDSTPEGLKVTISLASLRAILATFKPTRHEDPDLVMTFEDEKVTVEAGGALGGFLAAQVTWPLVAGEYPKILDIFAKAFASEAAPERLQVNPAFLTDFRHAQRAAEPVSIWGVENGASAVRIGDDFIGVIMFVRKTEGASLSRALDESWASLVATPPKAAATPARATRKKAGA